MKPIIAMASMALGSASIGTLIYLGSNPNALLSKLPPARSDVALLSVTPTPTPTPRRTEAPEQKPVIKVTHFRAQVRSVPRVQSKDASSSSPSEEPTLVACSDWRALGPASIEAGVGSGEHQVKLLCPAGANAQDTFMAEGSLHPTKMRLNDWLQTSQE